MANKGTHTRKTGPEGSKPGDGKDKQAGATRKTGRSGGESGTDEKEKSSRETDSVIVRPPSTPY